MPAIMLKCVLLRGLGGEIASLGEEIIIVNKFLWGIHSTELASRSMD